MARPTVSTVCSSVWSRSSRAGFLSRWRCSTWFTSWCTHSVLNMTPRCLRELSALLQVTHIIPTINNITAPDSPINGRYLMSKYSNNGKGMFTYFASKFQQSLQALNACLQSNDCKICEQWAETQPWDLVSLHQGVSPGSAQLYSPSPVSQECWGCFLWRRSGGGGVLILIINNQHHDRMGRSVTVGVTGHVWYLSLVVLPTLIHRLEDAEQGLLSMILNPNSHLPRKQCSDQTRKP